MAFGQTGINTGTGAEVTTDLVGAAVTQVVKLDGGVSGSSAPILGSTANGLQVDVTRMVDGANVTQGALGDAAVVTDTTGSVSGKLRGLVKIFADVWDATNHWLKCAVQGMAAAGANVSGNPVLVGGTDGTHAQSLLLNADGSQPIGGFTKRIVSSPVVTASSAYAAGQSLGTTLTLANAVRLASGSGAVQTVIISDKDKQSAALDVVFFTAAPAATVTDKTTFAPTAADILTVVGRVSVAAADYAAYSLNSEATKSNTGLGFSLPAGTSLFMCLVCRGTPTYTTTSSLQAAVVIAQD